MKGSNLILVLLTLLFDLNACSCVIEEVLVSKKVSSDPKITEYIKEWEDHHPEFEVKAGVGFVNEEEKRLCYALEFVKVNYNDDASILQKLKNSYSVWKEKRKLKEKIFWRIKQLLPRGWHVDVEDGENACK